MELKVSIFAAVILLFVLHTILTHLFNWLFRLFFNKDSIALPCFFFLNIFELIIFICLLSDWLN